MSRPDLPCRVVTAAASVLLLVMLGPGAVSRAAAQPPAAGASRQADAAAPIRVLPVRNNVYVLMGAGPNVTVSVGLDGVLMVDTGPAGMTEQVLAAIQQVQREVDARHAALAPPVAFGAETRSSIVEQRHEARPPKPVRYIVDTSAAPDHIGGNERVAKSGATYTGGNVAGQLSGAGDNAAILAHENVLVRLSTAAAGQAATPTAALPTDTYYGDSMKLSTFFNGEGVMLIHEPAAYSDGDTMVYFRGSDVIAAGDIFQTTIYPRIDVQHGGTIDGIINGLNHILDLAIPEFRSEGGTLVVPGHGRISDTADVAYYRDMVTIIRDRVQDLAAKGMTLEQVRAARPTADYDGRYGATTGPWTTDMFVEAVYRTISRGTAAGAGTTPTAPRDGRRAR